MEEPEDRDCFALPGAGLAMTKQIGVVGAGTMGRGIAQAAAGAGCGVVLYDLTQDIVERALSEIHRRLLRLEEKGKLKLGEALKIAGRIRLAADFDGFGDCDFVIEAVAESLQIKRQVFGKLEPRVPERCVLATNTSSISIDQIASVLAQPKRVIGMHFFNPVPVMKLVEVIRGAATSESALSATRELARQLGKTVVDAKDSPGFIVNRILRPYFLEPLYMLGRSESDIESIDQALREMGYPMGPFQLADFIGLDVDLAIAWVVYEGLGRPERLRPSPIQESLVRGGALGRKNGRGYYQYEGQRVLEPSPSLKGPALAPRAPKSSSEDIAIKVIKAQILEAELLVQEGVATAQHIDLATRLGTNAPRGPFEWKEELHA